MGYGLTSGLLWGLDTVILGIALSMAPYVGTAEALAFAAIVSAAFHDVFCAVWMFVIMAVRGRLKDTVAALKTRSGKVVAAAALLGGPFGMTGYVVAINQLGPGITAIISSFYPAFGAFLAVFVLKEKMELKRWIALAVAMAAIIVMGVAASDMEMPGDALVGILAALACVVGWGSEAVLLAWGMRDDSVDNETALQIRETTSGLVYLAVILPLFAAWPFAVQVFATPATAVIAGAALAGTVSYLFYYKGIDKIGAAKAMAANISYSAWAVVLGMVLLGHVPSPVEVLCCIAILCGTVLASADDWSQLVPGRRASS